MLSLPLSNSIVKTTADIIGITEKNISSLGVPSIYIDKNRSIFDYTKLNIITKVDDVVYLSTMSEGQTKEPRKASARINVISKTEVECPKKKTKNLLTSK